MQLAKARPSLSGVRRLDNPTHKGANPYMESAQRQLSLESRGPVILRARSASPIQSEYNSQDEPLGKEGPQSAAATLQPYGRTGRRYTEIADHTWTYVFEPATINTTPIMGYGNVPIPSYNSIARMGLDRSVSLQCITWNINDKTVKILTKLADFLSQLTPEIIGDVVCVSIQEIPPGSGNFHEDALAMFGAAVDKTHEAYISHRAWSQMMVVLIRKTHSRYATDPSIKFVAAAAIPKPLRTKGGIGLCFRLYQRWIVIVGCHMSHASLQQRIQDYHKIVRNLKFSNLNEFTGMDHMFAADMVIWMGDLNFRIDKDLGIKWNDNWGTRRQDIEKAMEYDGLNIVRQKALAFMEFEEAEITFQPTHKYEINSEEYLPKRVPSYTDRVLYYARQPEWIAPVDYNTIRGKTASDHRPVYCTLRLSVINKPIPQRFYSDEGPITVITKNPNAEGTKKESSKSSTAR